MPVPLSIMGYATFLKQPAIVSFIDPFISGFVFCKPKASPRQTQNLGSSQGPSFQKGATWKATRHSHGSRMPLFHPDIDVQFQLRCPLLQGLRAALFFGGWQQWQPPSRVWQQLVLKSQRRLTIFHSQKESVQSSLGKTVSTKTTTIIYYPPSLLGRFTCIHASPRLLNTWCFQNLDPPKTYHPNTKPSPQKLVWLEDIFFPDPLTIFPTKKLQQKPPFRTREGPNDQRPPPERFKLPGSNVQTASGRARPVEGFRRRRNRLVVWWWLTRGSDVLPGGTTQTKMMASRVGYVDPKYMILIHTPWGNSHVEGPKMKVCFKDDVLLNISEGFVCPRDLSK